jgi:hypothetical protein
MNDLSIDPPSATRDGRNDPEQQIEEERIFFNEVSDEQLEAAASGPIVTFTLSIVSLRLSVLLSFRPQGIVRKADIMPAFRHVRLGPKAEHWRLA